MEENNDENSKKTKNGMSLIGLICVGAVIVILFIAMGAIVIQKINNAKNNVKSSIESSNGINTAIVKNTKNENNNIIDTSTEENEVTNIVQNSNSITQDGIQNITDSIDSLLANIVTTNTTSTIDTDNTVNSNANVTEISKNIVGTYSVYEMIAGGELTTKEDLAILESYGLKITLKLNADKTGEINLMSVPQKIRYDDKYFYYEDGSSSTTPYKIENNKLIIEEEDIKISFEKISD